jgi:hypothetical protein
MISRSGKGQPVIVCRGSRDIIAHKEMESIQRAKKFKDAAICALKEDA